MRVCQLRCIDLRVPFVGADKGLRFRLLCCTSLNSIGPRKRTEREKIHRQSVRGSTLSLAISVRARVLPSQRRVSAESEPTTSATLALPLDSPCAIVVLDRRLSSGLTATTKTSCCSAGRRLHHCTRWRLPLRLSARGARANCTPAEAHVKVLAQLSTVEGAH